jgi:hypothetical protein
MLKLKNIAIMFIIIYKEPNKTVIKTKLFIRLFE